MNDLKQHIEQFFNLNQEDWNFVESLLEEVLIAKNDIVLKRNQFEHYIYFVKNGVFRFFFDLELKDITFDFAFPNQFISAYTSFLSNQPSDCNIQALADSALIKISKTHIKEIYKKTTWGESFGRMVAEELFMKKSKRETQLLTLSASERYDLLFKEQPELIAKIPQKYLASYIGITPQALSRIRKKAFG